MHIVFTDLDGTLLDERYSWAAAGPALELLARDGVPWVMVSSKTRAEMEQIRADIGHVHPFVVENGGAAYIPEGYFGARVPDATRRDGYEVLPWGTAYPRLVRLLEEAAALAQCRVRGFHTMSIADVAAATGLPDERAALAKEREYGEPFLVDDPERLPALLSAIERAGHRWTHGGRFYHLCGNNDKAVAVEALTHLFRRQYGAIHTVGLGDSLNDLPFLRVVQTAVVVRSARPQAPPLDVPGALRTRQAGPAGWNEAVLDLLGGRVTA